MKFTRRNFLETSLGCAVAGAFIGGGSVTPALALKDGELGDDGLHKQSWFIDSFLDLRDDQKEAAEAGKHFAIFWEQRGCPYCAEMHKVNLAKPEISNYIKTNFNVLQLDLYGPRNVVDFDGKEMSEKDLAQRWNVNFTPSIVFFPNSKEGLPSKSGGKLKIWQLIGYWKPYHFITTFEYVRSGQYKTQKFQRFLSAKTERLRASGKKVDIW